MLLDRLLKIWQNALLWRHETTQPIISMTSCMRGGVFGSQSADKVVDDGDAETCAPEYLNTVNIPNLPQHELKVKIGVL